MDKGTAFAIATQQSHATDKTPKGYGTEEGKSEAKSKYKDPGSMEKKPNPGNLKTKKLAGLSPSPMWGTIAGKASKPMWRSQAGFTPPGMKTPAEKLQKSMNFGSVKGNENLKPLNIKVGQKVDEKTDLSPLLGMGLSAGGTVLQAGAGGAMKSRTQAEQSTEGASELFDKIRKSSPVPVADTADNNSFFIPGKSKTMRERLSFIKNPEIQKNLEDFGLYQQEDVIKGLGQDPKKPFIAVGSGLKSPGILAHEIGHAQLDNSRLGRMIQNKGTILAGKLAPVAGLGLGYAAGRSDNEKAQTLGALSGGLMSIPQLAYEGAASLKGYKNLKRLGANPAQLRAARRSLLPAFGTYAGGAIASTGAGYLGRAMGRSDKEDAEAEANKQAADKRAFNMNMYSGEMNPPRLKHESSIPPWYEPPVKTRGPAPKLTGKIAAAPMQPMARLNTARKVGTPKATGPKGPSIAQIAKPKGYGEPLPGAVKMPKPF
jgi:hypothetical protein